MSIRILFICLFALLGVNSFGEEKLDSLKIGDKSPDFNATDRDAKEFSLKSLKGKYVYIDVWATWCGPCKREIPFMKELEKKFVGKKIAFVGISSEKNRGKWLEMLRIQKMDGIQLNTSGDESFIKAYKIRGIPRFILLDKKGRILNLNMTRPSDPKTEKALKELRGI